MLKGLRTRIIGKHNQNNFDKKFVLYTSLVLGFSGLFGVVLNSFLDFSQALVNLALVSSIIYFLIYVIGRFTSQLKSLKWAVSLFSLVLINGFWYYNYNSRGPVLYLFVVYFSLLIFIWNSRKVFLLFFLLCLNIVALFLIEVYFPEILSVYPTEMARIIDVYTGLFIFFSIIFIFTTAAKNNYEAQYKGTGVR